MFKTRKEELNLKEIKAYIKKHQALSTRFSDLQKRYENKASGSTISTPYPKYITDVLTGYFMGKPVTYTSDDKKFIDKLLEVFKYNDEADHNTELAKMASINGLAYELLYSDEEAKARFMALNPAESFVITDASLAEEPLYFVRYYKIDDMYRIEIRDSQKVEYAEGKDIDQAELISDEIEEHFFGAVPVAIYENNKEKQGDFEPVLSLIDAYNETQSNTLKDLNDFTDAYLNLEGMQGTNEEDVTKFKKDKILLLPEGGKAYWLVKSVNDSWVENFKTRVQHDIHKFSFTPDLTDKNFAGNLSGVSLKYKLLAMEELRGIKENKFRKGLMRRIELISNVLKLTNSIEGYTDIDMQFNNTLPENIYELSQIINNLAPYLSEQTLLSRLPFVDDVDAELERKKAESEASFDSGYEA